MRAVELKGLTYTYSVKTPFEKRALDNVSLAVEEGEFVGLIGATGSGKSTLIQHLNGLVKVQQGEVSVEGMNASDKKTLKKLRFTVGMVFQYPEYQLFEDTVAKDVAFGPKNMKLDKEEVERRVRRAMEVVGLPYEEFAERSPFELSGGEKRRAAIAGVIAMEPKILVLDEPVAGLDPHRHHGVPLYGRHRGDGGQDRRPERGQDRRGRIARRSVRRQGKTRGGGTFAAHRGAHSGQSGGKGHSPPAHDSHGEGARGRSRRLPRGASEVRRGGERRSRSTRGGERRRTLE